MLKKLAKRIDKELNLACDYVEQAMLVKHDHRELADLFMSLAAERTEDIEKMYRVGFNLIDQKDDNVYSRPQSQSERERSKYSQFEEAKTIWDWEYRISNEKVSDLKQKIQNYKR